MTFLTIKGLKVHFFTDRGVVRAVDEVSLNVGAGERVGLAGESACGKSTLAYSIMKLVPQPGRIVEGEINFKGTDIVRLDEENMQKIRWSQISMVFQDSMSALNPVIRVGEQIAEAILLHEKSTKQEARKRAVSLFESVGLKAEHLENFSFEFSGGMRQRAVIAMALACTPDIVIADEPTTALDVTTQAQMTSLLNNLSEAKKMSFILITHNLSVIAETCDRVVIMYAGKTVEKSTVAQLFQNPIHPYTKGLIAAVPSMEKAKEKALFSIPGEPPNLINPPSGCRFHLRCPYAKDICVKEVPEPRDISGHSFHVECHFADEMKDIPVSELWAQ